MHTAVSALNSETFLSYTILTSLLFTDALIDLEVMKASQVNVSSQGRISAALVQLHEYLTARVLRTTLLCGDRLRCKTLFPTVVLVVTFEFPDDNKQILGSYCRNKAC